MPGNSWRHQNIGIRIIFLRDFDVFISRVLANQHYGDVNKWQSDLSENKGVSGIGGIRYYSTVHKGSIYTINPFTFLDTESNIAISRDVEFGGWLVFPKHIPSGPGSIHAISSNKNYLAIWSYRNNAISMLHLVPWLDPSARIDIPIDLPYDNFGFGPSFCFSINNDNQIMIGGWRHPDTFPGDDRFMFHIYHVDIDENQYEKLWEYTNNGWHNPGWPAGFITNDYAVFAESDNIAAASGGAFTIFNVSTGQVLIDKQSLYPVVDEGTGIYHVALKDDNLYFVSEGGESPFRVHHYKLLENDGVLSANYQSHIEQLTTPVFTGVWVSI